ncbi:hypothetical protein Tco_0108717 [Tanacetum coccineum]
MLRIKILHDVVGTSRYRAKFCWSFPQGLECFEQGISPAFVEANYKILESLLRERRRKIRNEDLRTELEYFSEDYDEEREMEPRPEPRRVGNMRGRNARGFRPSEIEAREGENRGEAISLRLTWGETSLLTMGNPPAGGTYAYHPQGGYIPHAFTKNSVPSYNSPMHPTVTPSSSYPFYTQPMYAPPNMPAHPNPAGPFADSASSLTHFVRWIEDYRLLDGLKCLPILVLTMGKGTQIISYTFSKGPSACRNG